MRNLLFRRQPSSKHNNSTLRYYLYGTLYADKAFAEKARLLLPSVVSYTEDRRYKSDTDRVKANTTLLLYFLSAVHTLDASGTTASRSMVSYIIL